MSGYFSFFLNIFIPCCGPNFTKFTDTVSIQDNTWSTDVFLHGDAEWESGLNPLHFPLWHIFFASHVWRQTLFATVDSIRYLAYPLHHNLACHCLFIAAGYITMVITKTSPYLIWVTDTFLCRNWGSRGRTQNLVTIRSRIASHIETTQD